MARAILLSCLPQPRRSHQNHSPIRFRKSSGFFDSLGDEPAKKKKKKEIVGCCCFLDDGQKLTETKLDWQRDEQN